MATSFNYPRAAAAALRLITKAGGNITVIRKVQSGDPAKPTIEDVATVGKGVDFDVETSELDGKTVLVGDRKAYVAPSLGVEAKPGDRYVSVDGLNYEIKRVQKLAPNGTVLLWTYLIRK